MKLVTRPPRPLHPTLNLGLLILALASLPAFAEWQPARGPLMTRWAKDVSPENAHREYPRPQMTREAWLNLNGLWDYAIVAKDAARPDEFQGQILVPFPVESALSGVMKRVNENQRLWYKRTFKLPDGWQGKNVLLHFGAVDWEATVFVNGKEIGAHRGGYDAFRFDITSALKDSGEQELVVAVFDPTDAGTQPRGKQVRNPHGIWYTPTSGIWQTVWLEPVAKAHVESIKLTPNIDNGSITVAVHARAAGEVTVRAEVLDQGRSIADGMIQISGAGADGTVAPAITLAVPNAKLWTPDSPFLYDLKVSVSANGREVDRVSSYFGMRKISVAKDDQGTPRLMLNNQRLFQFGPLDQGFWPDGLYTAPTDEALRYDIEMTKKLGMNMARKHVKIEPARWYYWCDKLGLLVWQDMPSGDKYIGGRDPDITRTPESAKQFETELKALVEGFGNHPSIVMWVPYNEGWGQWDSVRIANLVKEWDPTRLVNHASGWTDRGAGDVNDIHVYPGPSAPKIESRRAGVLGEFGGLGLPVSGHTWQEERNWGYRSFKNSADLTEAYLRLIDKLHPLTGTGGLSAAVYTQTTDVEIEVNGLMTYDRALVKMDVEAITAANKTLYTPPAARKTEAGKLTPPATPLVACDPYFSIWSPADKLASSDTTHWTGKPHRLTSMVRIDGKAYRVLGAEPLLVPPLEQKSLSVLPTRSVYTFEGAGVALTLTFMTPAIPYDIDLLARPVTYVGYEFRSTDGKSHEVSIYFDAAAEIAVNEPRQQVEWKRESVSGLDVLRVGSKDQPILAKKGDDIRIDWGYLYIAAPRAQSSASEIVPPSAARRDFASGGVLAAHYDQALTAGPAENAGVAAFVLRPGTVAKEPLSRWLMLAYDDLYSIKYMGKNLRPFWRRNGWEAADLLKASAQEYSSLADRCRALDTELMADLTRAGGENYAKLCALAYRQCFAAGKFVADENGQPMQFSKENHSNGCIGTSDVFYPMSPQFLLFGPSVAKSFLVPFMNYAASPRWKFPFAPHDLGTYPHATGQVYGGGERTEENQMPVEESGNLLLLMAAVAQMEGNADFAGLYWPQLERWADYLRNKGFDPENQLCTDDFAGHLAHNVNLSAKAICALGAFAKLCEMRGDRDAASEYRKLAKEFAERWVKEADDGDHYRLAFDRSGTWSQKYNLVWDRILGLNLFPAEVLRKEMDYYKKVQNTYGLPLDNRATYTKLDWILWTATLTQKREDFEALVDPVILFLNETPDHSPMTDWYQTKTARRVGFTARPVVGGVFLQMLYDKAAWSKYARRDQTKAADWAPMPTPPKTSTVIPTSEQEAIRWRFTTQRPPRNWFERDFDASSWKEAPGGFGTRGTPGAVVRTEWSTSDIWLRREFTLPEVKAADFALRMHHDEDVEVYIDGILAASAGGYTTGYEVVELSAAAKAALKPGKHVVAVHCRQTGGGQYIDLGLVQLTPVSAAASGQPAHELIGADPRGSLYIANREPLLPSRLMKLPIGSIVPRGWLRHQLALEADGMIGHLTEISKWCKFEGNAWASPEGQGHSGWEELPYWLKGFGDLGYVLQDQRIIQEARRWIEAVLSSQEPSGWFGPRALKTSLEGKPDLWPHMVMLNVLQSFHEYTRDERVIPFMLNYHRWLNQLPPSSFGQGYWPRIRFGDNIETAYWLYNRTGERWLLDLSNKIHENMQDWTTGVHNWHNVNIAQGFREPGVYYLQARDLKFLNAAERNYQIVRGQYGQFPGGGFAGDENCRPGFDDPRQGFETCGIVEFMHSFQMLTKIATNPLWSDRCEELAFNTLPPALTPDLKGLHYLTSANQVQLDKENKSPGIQNGGTMFSYSPFEAYRCCQHNVSHGWPYYAEELWLATADRGLCASLYAASEVTAKVGDGSVVAIAQVTDYPFDETVTLRITTPKSLEFPLYLRIPGWCENASVKVNGEDITADARPLSYAKVVRQWKNGDTVTLRLPMNVRITKWEKNHNAVSVDRGPLTFSLRIGETWRQYGKNPAWPEWEVLPTTAWNYGLVLPQNDPEGAFEVAKQKGPLPSNPFTPETAPIQLRAKAKKIPAWKTDQTALVGVLQDSPVKSGEPTETVTLIPMGAARLRISAFPVIGEGSNAREWKP